MSVFLNKKDYEEAEESVEINSYDITSENILYGYKNNLIDKNSYSQSASLLRDKLQDNDNSRSNS